MFVILSAAKDPFLRSDLRSIAGEPSFRSRSNVKRGMSNEPLANHQTEYLSRILTKGFWIGTAIVPLMIFGFTVLPSLLLSRTKSSPEPVRIVDAPAISFRPAGKPQEIEWGREESARAARDPGRRSPDQIRTELNGKTEKGRSKAFSSSIRSAR